MKHKRVKKWLLRIVFILGSIITLGIIFVNYELKHMYGGFTEEVDGTQFDIISKPIIITNVRLLSPDGSHFIENQTVWLENGKISRIDTINQLSSDHLVINAQGKYLIPGLINSHVHLWKSPNDLLLYVANGVTQIKEMMGSAKHLKWRQEIEDDKRLGPKMFVASNKIQSFGRVQGWFMKWMQENINLNKTNKAISTFQLLSDEGYDAVKVGSLLNKEHYKAVSAAAGKVNIPLIGHLPLSVGLKELWESNQKELAHIEEIVKALRSEFGKVNKTNKKAFLKFVEKRSFEVADSLIKKDITVTTTLWLTESFLRQKFELKKVLKEVKLSYANPGIIEGTILTSRGLGWLPDVNLYRLSPDITPGKLSKEKNYWTAYAEASRILVHSMAKKGVKMLAGTDANLPVVVPGFSIHDELVALTKAGMTPSQALLSATVVPAAWMKIKSGRILPGFRADLVLLNKNPLENIENTKTIEMVILKGKVFHRSQLDAILNAVKEANDRSRNKEISQFLTSL